MSDLNTVTINHIYFNNNRSIVVPTELIDPNQISITKCETVIIEDGEFNNNYFSEITVQARIILLQLINDSTIKNVRFNQNTNLRAITFYKGQNAKLEYANIQNGNSIDTAGVLFWEQQLSIANHLYMYNLQASEQYAGLCFQGYLNKLPLTIQTKNVTAESCKSYGIGGNSLTFFTVFNCVNCFAHDIVLKDGGCLRGGGLLTYYANAIQLKNITFINNFAEFGGGIYGYNANYIFYDDITFLNNRGTQGGGFNYEGSTNIVMKNMNFTQNQGQQYTAGFFLDCENITMNNTIISDNIASLSIGGLGFLNNVGVQLFNVTGINNKAVTTGFMSLSNVQNSTFTKINITNNLAFQMNVGALVISSSENITLTDFIVQGNIASQDIGALQFIFSKNITLNNFFVFNNTSSQLTGGLNMIKCINININNSRFCQNQASVQGGGIQFINSSIIKLLNVTFDDNKSQYGAGLFIKGSDHIDIIDSYMFNNIAQNGGALYIEYSNNINILNNDIISNQAEQGGASYILNSNTIIYKLTKIHENIASIYGGAFIVKEQSNDITIQDCTVYENQSLINGGFIYFNDILQFNIINSQIYNNTAISQGGAIYSIIVNNLFILNSDFYFNSAQLGGCIYNNNVIKLNLENNFFHLNNAYEKGSVLYSKDGEQITIQGGQIQQNFIIDTDQVIIEKNKQKGGAIFIKQQKEIKIENVIIKLNFAYQQGGSIHLTNFDNLIIKNTIFNENNVQFQQNIPEFIKDEQYSTSQGGHMFIENGGQLIQMYNTSFIQGSASSGGAIFLINQSEQTKFIFQLNTFEKNQADLGTSLRILGNSSQLENLNFTLENQISKDNFGELSSNQIFTGYFRNEKKNQGNFQYTLCPIDSFLPEDYLGVESCSKCLENGECLGGYIPIYPSKDYWRSQENQMEFLKCLKKPNHCLGNDTCLEGTQGLLCEDCQLVEGYAKQANGDCTKCQGNEIYLAILFVSLIVTFTLVVQQIYGINSKVKFDRITKIILRVWEYPILQSSVLGGIGKIVLMHIQILYLTNSIKFEYSLELFQVFTAIGNPSQGISVQLSCLFNPQNQSDLPLQHFQQQLLGVLLTFLVLFLMITINLILLACNYFKRKYFQGYLFCTFISFFITVAPGYIQNTMSYLACREVAGQRYSKGDNLINCDDDLYTHTILPYNLVVFIFSFAVIPLILLMLLYRQFKKAGKKRSNIQNKFLLGYGILFIEYKDSVYYWEIVNMAMKGSIAILSILFSEYEEIKGYTIVLVLIMYAISLQKFKPFKNKNINKLSLSGSLVQIVCISTRTVQYTQVIENQKREDLMEYFSIIAYIVIITLHVYLLFQILQVTRYDILIVFRKILIRLKILHKFPYFYKQMIREQKAKIRWVQLKQYIRQSIRETKEENSQDVVVNYEHHYLTPLERKFQIKQDKKIIDVQSLTILQNSRKISKSNFDQDCLSIKNLNLNQRYSVKTEKNYNNLSPFKLQGRPISKSIVKFNNQRNSVTKKARFEETPVSQTSQFQNFPEMQDSNCNNVSEVSSNRHILVDSTRVIELNREIFGNQTSRLQLIKQDYKQLDSFNPSKQVSFMSHSVNHNNIDISDINDNINNGNKDKNKKENIL